MTLSEDLMKPDEHINRTGRTPNTAAEVYEQVICAPIEFLLFIFQETSKAFCKNGKAHSL